MSFAEEIDAGRATLSARDYAEAYRAFGRAHNAGHAIKRDHLAAHRGMVVAATKAGRVDRAAKNIVRMGAALLFDRDQSRARGR